MKKPKHFGSQTLSNKEWCIQSYFRYEYAESVGGGGGWAHLCNKWYKRRRDAERALWDLHANRPFEYHRLVRNDFIKPPAYDFGSELEKMFPVRKKPKSLFRIDRTLPKIFID
jgi:hypothetical protein